MGALCIRVGVYTLMAPSLHPQPLMSVWRWAVAGLNPWGAQAEVGGTGNTHLSTVSEASVQVRKLRLEHGGSCPVHAADAWQTQVALSPEVPWRLVPRRCQTMIQRRGGAGLPT